MLFLLHSFLNIRDCRNGLVVCLLHITGSITRSITLELTFIKSLKECIDIRLAGITGRQFLCNILT